MVKKLLIIVVLCLSWLDSAGQVKTYVIQRGETLQSVAKKFGVSESQIRECNQYVKNYHVGLNIKLPAGAKQQTPDEVFANDRAVEKMNEAKRQLEAGKKLLALELLKESLGYKRLDEAEYLAGKLYYDRHEYDMAFDYFQRVKNEQTLSYEQQNSLDKMLVKIDLYKEKKRIEEEQQQRVRTEQREQRIQMAKKQWQGFNPFNMYNQYMNPMPNQNIYAMPVQGRYDLGSPFGFLGNYNSPGLDSNYQLGSGSGVDDIMYNAIAEQRKLQQWKQEVAQGLEQSQIISQQQFEEMQKERYRNAWADFGKDYERHVEYFKAQGWIPLSREAFYQNQLDNSTEQTRMNLEYIRETNNIRREERNAYWDLEGQESKGRVNNFKMYNDLKSDSYKGIDSYSSSSSGSSSTSSYTPSYTYYNTSSNNTATAAGGNQEDPTYREQYRNKKVYEDDYRDTRQKVTLYRRDGDKAYADYHNMIVYEKKGQKYILIDNMYYPIESCNWNGYHYYIHYKFRLYLNL